VPNKSTNNKIKPFTPEPVLSKSGKKKVMHNGKVVYEWSQTMEEINITVPKPDFLKAKDIECKMTPDHISMKLKGAKEFYFNHDFSHYIVTEQSFWIANDDVINIDLQKAKIGTTWKCVFKGEAETNPMEQQEDKQRLMLERFQREHPGFDFSNAAFSGQAPDARKFMGGFDTNKIK